jgi:hypothetical protein
VVLSLASLLVTLFVTATMATSATWIVEHRVYEHANKDQENNSRHSNILAQRENGSLSCRS